MGFLIKFERERGANNINNVTIEIHQKFAAILFCNQVFDHSFGNKYFKWDLRR